jgi:hypothetical protein
LTTIPDHSAGSFGTAEQRVQLGDGIQPGGCWGDYSWGFFLPGTGGRIYFANEYIQHPNCTGRRSL